MHAFRPAPLTPTPGIANGLPSPGWSTPNRTQGGVGCPPDSPLGVSLPSSPHFQADGGRPASPAPATPQLPSMPSLGTAPMSPLMSPLPGSRVQMTPLHDKGFAPISPAQNRYLPASPAHPHAQAFGGAAPQAPQAGPLLFNSPVRVAQPQAQVQQQHQQQPQPVYTTAPLFP